MDATMTAVKEYLEFWLTKRTADMKKAHEEQLSTVKVSADLPLRSLHSCPVHRMRHPIP